MEKRHIINLQGRDFVTFEGLLNEAHARGLRGIDVAILQFPSEQNDNTAICRATVTLLQDGEVFTFTDIGDANPKNVNRNIASHLIRMASTRAKARALRDAINVGMTAVEELEHADLPPEERAPARQATAKPAAEKPGPGPTEAQIKRLYAIAKANGVTSKEDLRVYMAQFDGYPEKESQLSRAQYDALCSALDGQKRAS